MKNIVNYLEDITESCSSSKMRKSNKHTDMMDAVKAYKKKSRDEEIAMYGKPINHNKVFRSKKEYRRNPKHRNRDF